MNRKAVMTFKDGDSGEYVGMDGRKKRFRLSNVSAPEKNDPGYNLSTTRSRKLVSERDIVDVKVVGRDSFGRDLVEVKKRGKDINHILEMKNRLFDVRPPR